VGGGGDTELDVIVTVELGDTSYLLVSEGEAVLVDPQRDAWRFVAAAEERGRRSGSAETHVHNDYVSGALEAEAATGRRLRSPRRRLRVPAPRDGRGRRDPGRRRHAHRVAHTGHTPEHLSYVVRAGGADDPVAVFTAAA
jgi:glyoxylase-like metal-dependent hydrolase (beta-lactamase superfamily II)